jgi:hypothetical protein
MAKITARDDKELARFKDDDGREYVLTEQGRLLYRWRRGEGFSLSRRNCSLEQAERIAERAGMVRA